MIDAWAFLNYWGHVPGLTPKSTPLTLIIASNAIGAKLPRRGTWWRLGCDDDFQPEGRGFDSRSGRHVGTSPIPTIACALWRETPIQYPCCSRERL